MIKKLKAQIAIEYILLFVAVVIVIVAFIAPKGIFRSSVENTLNSTMNAVSGLADTVNYDGGGMSP